jgi:S-adenosylmethionine-diacylgycerolhomoserine-N-methlytransferase
MDRIYRVQRHIYDWTRKPYLLGRDRLIAEAAPPPDGTVLEIACGTGRNLVAVARRYPSTRVYGFDISAEMLKTAAASVRRSGLSDRVALAQADARDFDPQAAFGEVAFDRVFVSYALSMIPQWRQALRHGLHLTRPDGALSLVDFGGCEALPSSFKAGLYAWLACFHVTPRADLEDAVATAAAAFGARPSVTPLARGYAVYARIDRQSARG